MRNARCSGPHRGATPAGQRQPRSSWKIRSLGGGTGVSPSPPSLSRLFANYKVRRRKDFPLPRRTCIEVYTCRYRHPNRAVLLGARPTWTAPGGGGSSKFAFQKPLIRAAKGPTSGRSALGAHETRRRANILASLSQIAFETLRIRHLNNEDDREQSQVEPMFPGNDPMLVLAKMRAIRDRAKARTSKERMATGPSLGGRLASAAASAGSGATPRSSRASPSRDRELLLVLPKRPWPERLPACDRTYGGRTHPPAH